MLRSCFRLRLTTDTSPIIAKANDAKDCGVPAVVNFVRTLMIDIQAVRNAVIERWSNGAD
jgi:transposase